MEASQSDKDPFSPARDRIEEMRRDGTCVTAHHDLTNAGQPVVPADPTVVSAEVIPPPKSGETSGS